VLCRGKTVGDPRHFIRELLLELSKFRLHPQILRMIFAEVKILQLGFHPDDFVSKAADYRVRRNLGQPVAGAARLLLDAGIVRFRLSPDELRRKVG
jgi:hypothetical protein